MEWLGRYPNQQDREIDRLEERLQAAILVLKSYLARMRSLVRCSEHCDPATAWHATTCAVTRAEELEKRGRND